MRYKYPEVGLLEVSDVTTGSSNSIDANDEGEYVFFDRSRIIKRSKRYIFDGEAIIVPGEGQEFTPRYYKGKFDLHQRAYCVFPKEGTDGKFLYYAITYKRAYFAQIAVGSTVKSLRRDSFKIFKIPHPDIQKQRKISKILSSFDDLIEVNSKINDYLEELMLVEYDNLDKGEWRTCALSEYYKISIGRTPPRKETKWFSTDPSDVPWVSIADMGLNSRFISKTTEYITEDAVDKFNIVVVPEGTIILSFKLTLGRVSVAGSDMCTNEAIAHLNTTDAYLLEFIYCVLKRYDYRLLGNTSSIGTAVNSKTIRSMPISLPAVEVIREFHTKWSPLMKTIKIIEYENRKLKTLRDFLLPRLIQGKFNVF